MLPCPNRTIQTAKLVPPYETFLCSCQGVKHPPQNTVGAGLGRTPFWSTLMSILAKLHFPSNFVGGSS
jgi:hypothetical protein